MPTGRSPSATPWRPSFSPTCTGGTCRERLPSRRELQYQLQTYDLEALQVETDLLLDWYAPHLARQSVPASARLEFTKLWRSSLAPLLGGSRTWTLRDFHSPNLLWLPKRAGLARLGLLDFQDAVMGHPAYDLVSLLQDARVDVPPDLELKLLAAYAHARKLGEPGFDMADFAAAYATLGAQRATKISASSPASIAATESRSIWCTCLGCEIILRVISLIRSCASCGSGMRATCRARSPRLK